MFHNFGSPSLSENSPRASICQTYLYVVEIVVAGRAKVVTKAAPSVLEGTTCLEKKKEGTMLTTRVATARQ